MTTAIALAALFTVATVSLAAARTARAWADTLRYLARPETSDSPSCGTVNSGEAGNI